MTPDRPADGLGAAPAGSARSGQSAKKNGNGTPALHGALLSATVLACFGSSIRYCLLTCPIKYSDEVG
jgi:hypothetical protein